MTKRQLFSRVLGGLSVIAALAAVWTGMFQFGATAAILLIAAFVIATAPDML